MTPVDEGREVFDAVRRHLSPGLALGYQMLARGAWEVAAEGATVRLSDGRDLVDFGSYAVTLLGHRNPHVVAAVSAQLHTMPTATRALANPAVTAFAEALLDRVRPLDRVWFGSDGADAVEVSIKLARRSSGRLRVLAAEGAFHGKTLGALALTAAPAYRAGLEPLLTHVTHLDRDDPSAVARACANGGVAALILEPVRLMPAPPPRFSTRGGVYWGVQQPDVLSQDYEEGDGTLRGTPCSPGIVTAEARVVDSPRDVGGGVLVTYRTDPGWVGALSSAAALLIERGSPLTHVAIVARELGVPTVVQIPGLTTRIKTGMSLTVDGGTGIVQINPPDQTENDD